MSESFAFNADISQLMSLIINTFYSNKEIFLRELVSNASDALSKANIASISDSSYLDDEPELAIRIIPDRDNKTLTIEDTGVGMTRDELISNLGTLAKSGTRAYIEKIQEASEAGADIANMIGQFGVGFYSAYLVASKVEVYSKARDNDAFKWVSEAGSSFSVEKVDDCDLKRGTRIILHMKKDQMEYLEPAKIKELIKKHSEFISYPISLVTYTTTEEEVEGEDEDAEKKTETVTKSDSEVLNTVKPLWTRKPEDVTNDEYAAFYKAISADWQEHLAVKHFHLEGQLDFKAILYVPKNAPSDMFETSRKANQIKLYVRRVFIMDDCKDLMPEYLGFIRGIVDSEDLPLNISRETLQHNKIIRTIRRTLVKKVLELFNEIADNKEDYAKFYEAFAKNLKLGVHEDTANREKLAELLRFHSTKSGNEMISFRDYIANMKDGQKGIYYIIGETRQSIENSPFLEKLKKKGIEVLLMSDPMDEYMTSQLKEFEDHKLISCTKENLDLLDDDEKAELEQLKGDYEPLCRVVKDVLGDAVEKVVIGDRMAHSPCVLVTGEFGWSANMERIMRSQPLRDAQMSMFMSPKKTMELNPYHTIVSTLKKRVDESGEHVDKTVKDMIWLLYETSLLTSGFSLDEPIHFASRIHKLISLGISADDFDEDVDATDDEEQDVPDLEDGDDEEENVMESID